MKKKAFLLSIFTIVLFASCLKKNNTEPEEEVVPIVVSHPDGYLKNYLLCTSKAGSSVITRNYIANAYFYADSIVTDLVNVDSISVNKRKLTPRGDKMYYWSDSVPVASESAWYVKGNNGVSSFDYTLPIPTYASYALLPDSINRLVDFVIPVSDLINATKGTFTLYDNVGKNIVKAYKPGDASITFTAYELSYLHKTGNFYLYIDLYNQLTQKLNGERFYFENRFTIDKYIKPY